MERINMEDLAEKKLTEEEEKEVKGGATFVTSTSPTTLTSTASIPTLTPTSSPISGVGVVANSPEEEEPMPPKPLRG